MWHWGHWLCAMAAACPNSVEWQRTEGSRASARVSEISDRRLANKPYDLPPQPHAPTQNCGVETHDCRPAPTLACVCSVSEKVGKDTLPSDPCGHLKVRQAQNCPQLGCGECDECQAHAVQRIGVCSHQSSLVALTLKESITLCGACQST